MYATIKQKLPVVEKKLNIQLLYVAESGSRGWGFASPDSDYDVRAIFIHPRDNYFSIDEPKESFEYIEDTWFDIGGWELRKALRLLRKSNSTLIEWLQSPIVYHNSYDLQSQLLSLARHYYQPGAAIYHYRGIARSAEKSTTTTGIGLKKWFYILRPLLAAYWCLTQQSIPPMQLEPLLSLLPISLQQEIAELVIFKNQQDEAYLWTPTPTLQQCITTLWLQTDIKLASKCPPDSEMLNQWFRSKLDEINYR